MKKGEIYIYCVQQTKDSCVLAIMVPYNRSSVIRNRILKICSCKDDSENLRSTQHNLTKFCFCFFFVVVVFAF